MNYPTEITFEISGDQEYDEPSSYVYIADPSDCLERMLNPDEIVTPNCITIEFDYPLKRPVLFDFIEGPYSRRELARVICEKYQEIYDAEDESTNILASQRAGNILNRNCTDGIYGIWGHSIGDLTLHTVDRNRDGVYTLGVYS